MGGVKRNPSKTFVQYQENDGLHFAILKLCLGRSSLQMA